MPSGVDTRSERNARTPEPLSAVTTVSQGPSLSCLRSFFNFPDITENILAPIFGLGTKAWRASAYTCFPLFWIG